MILKLKMTTTSSQSFDYFNERSEIFYVISLIFLLRFVYVN